MAVVFMKEGRFALGETLHEYEGFDTGMYWNGWNRPYFTKEVAKKVLAENQLDENSNKKYDWRYDAENNRFVISWIDTSAEEIAESFYIISVGGEINAVYPIGFEWEWARVDITTTFHIFKSLYEETIIVPACTEAMVEAYKRLVKCLDDGYNIRYVDSYDYQRAAYEITDLTDIKLVMRKIGRWREIPKNISSLVIVDNCFPFYNRSNEKGEYKHMLVIQLMTGTACYKAITISDNSEPNKEDIDFILSFVSISAAALGKNKYEYMNEYYRKAAKEAIKQYELEATKTWFESED